MDSSSPHPLCDVVLGIGDDDLEEGEFVPGHYHSSSSDTDDDVVYPQHGGRTRRLEDIIAAGRVGAVPLPPLPTPSSESGEGTISDHRSASSAEGGGGARKFACHVCGKGFSSRKAVDGHMRVHSSGSGGHVVAQPDVLSAGWAATGRRGMTGGKARKPSAAAAASLNSESTGQSTAVVAVQVQPPLEPVPMAFAVAINLSPLPSSTRTNLSSGEGDEGSSAASATATAQPMHYDEPVVAAAAVVTGANPSSTVAVAVAVAGARAAGPVEHQLAAVENQAPAPQAQFVQQPLLAPPAAAVQLQQGGQLVPLPHHAQPPREYSCKVCGKTYPSHQGLGGHAAGHKNRQREQEAMAAAAGMMMMPNGGGGGGGAKFLAALRRGRKAEVPHACQKCNKVFATGVALGGHMRMHYTGPAIVHKSNNKKRCMALASTSTAPPPPAVSEADLRLALSAAIAEAEPAAVAGGASRLRLFGVNIPLGQAPSEQQDQSGKTEGSSSDGEQQHK